MKPQRSKRAYQVRDTTEDNETEMEVEDEPKITFMVQSEIAPNDEGESMIWYEWFADSGTTSHITRVRTALTDFVPTKSEVMGIGNEPLEVKGRGTVELESYIGRQKVKFYLKNVLYVPSTSNNLLSICQLDKDGGCAKFGSGKVALYARQGQHIAEGTISQGLYKLNVRAKIKPLKKAHTVRQRPPADWLTWHKQYGHVAITGLKKLYNDKLVEGFNIDQSEPIFECEACIRAKQIRELFPNSSDHHTEKPCELTHSDVWGPARTQSIGGARYYISFVDDCSRRCTVEFMKQKSEAIVKVKQYVAYLERQ